MRGARKSTARSTMRREGSYRRKWWRRSAHAGPRCRKTPPIPSRPTPSRRCRRAQRWSRRRARSREWWRKSRRSDWREAIAAIRRRLTRTTCAAAMRSCSRGLDAGRNDQPRRLLAASGALGLLPHLQICLGRSEDGFEVVLRHVHVLQILKHVGHQAEVRQAIVVEIERADACLVWLQRVALIRLRNVRRNRNAFVEHRIFLRLRLVALGMFGPLGLAVAERFESLAGVFAESRGDHGDERHVAGHAEAAGNFLVRVVVGKGVALGGIAA